MGVHHASEYASPEELNKDLALTLWGICEWEINNYLIAIYTEGFQSTHEYQELKDSKEIKAA